jgi:hypothetical protein
MSEQVITGTFFFHASARHKQDFVLTPQELSELIRTHSAPHKDDLQWIKLAGFGALLSPGKSLRHDGNVNYVTGVEGDYDSDKSAVKISFDEAVQILEDNEVESIIYTTPSHTPEQPHFRVLCPFYKRHQPKDRARFMARLNGLFRGAFARESFTLSQSYYIGFVTNGSGGGAHHQVEYIAGHDLDGLDHLDAGAVWPQDKKPKTDGSGDYETVEFPELINLLCSGGDFHPLLPPIIGTMVARGTPRPACVGLMRGMFELALAQRPDIEPRWNEVLEVIDWVYKKEAAKQQQPQQQTPPSGLIKSSKQFVADFTPPDFLVDRFLIQSFLYALTGQTGAGKTAITLRLAASVALGVTFSGLDVTARRVLYLAAENPIDVQMRWIALAQQMDFDPDTIAVFFVEGIFKISNLDMLKTEAERVGGDFGLIIIDTGPAFYEGDDQNSRTEMFRHARTFRDLINGIPGKPTVLANMHPTKRVGEDGLVPAGGGSFLNEIDGNLTATKDGDDIELHWCGKLRGIEFNPLNFTVRSVTHERLKDRKGKLIPTVICEPISERAKEDRKKAAREDRKLVLAIMRDDPFASLADIAQRMGWFLGNTSIPYKSKADRAAKRLLKDKWVKKDALDQWELTDAGRQVLA